MKKMTKKEIKKQLFELEDFLRDLRRMASTGYGSLSELKAVKKEIAELENLL